VTGRLARLGAVALLVVAIAACDLQTAGAPKGRLKLYAEFDDAQHLVAGHAVKVADVQVGTVTKVALDGVRARVTMSIEDGRRIPVGTTATLSQTSLLGENYVQLQFPESFDATTGPFLTSGSTIEHTGVEPTLEHVTEQAINALGAIETGDLSAIVQALATGFGGRGAELHQLIDDLATVGTTFASQSADIQRVLDGLGKLGHDLAANSNAVGTLIDDVASATSALSGQRDRFVDALGHLNDLATALNEHVLEPHSAQLDHVLQQLAPIAATLAQDRDTIGLLLDNLRITSERGGHAQDASGAILIYAWITGLILPGGQVVSTTSGGDAVHSLLEPPS
jgi:phospholipid/cholesterol/gamma-HCH transport system substrate-binding protein